MTQRGKLTPLRLYRLGWGAIGGVVLALSLAEHGIGDWQSVALLTIIGVIAEGRSMRVTATRKLELSVAFIPVVLAAILYGPGAGALVSLVCMLGDRRGDPDRWIMYLGVRAANGAAAGAAAEATRTLLGGTSLFDYLVIAVAAAIAMSAVDFVANLFHVKLQRSMSAAELWGLVRGSLGLNLALYTPLVALYAFAFTEAGNIVLAFFAIPLLAAHLWHSMFAKQRQLIEKLTSANTRLEEVNAQLRRVNLNFAATMVRALEARDEYT